MAGCAHAHLRPGRLRGARRGRARRGGRGTDEGRGHRPAQSIPLKFLENILGDLRHAGLVRSQRGADGRLLAQPPGRRDRRGRRHPRRRGPAGLGARRPRPRTSTTAARRSPCSRCGSPCGPACAASSSASRWPTWPPAASRARDQARGGPRGVGHALAPEIAATDYHTAGEPFRIVTAGVPTIPGATVRERREHAAASEAVDAVRRLLCHEPRGHADMYGCFLVAARRRRRRPRRAVLAQGRLLDRVRARHDRARRLGGRVGRGGRAARRRGRGHDRRAVRPRRRARCACAAGAVERVAFRNVPSYVVARERAGGAASPSTSPTAARSTPRVPAERVRPARRARRPAAR